MNKMMIAPFSIPVSVIMGIYNEPLEWIKQSIDSILNQTFVDFEFIIVNDNPLRYENYIQLKEYQQIDKRIVIVENESNIGLTESLNKALLLAKGKYIARMDADDISLPNRLMLQYQYMEEHLSVVVCGTNFKCIGKNSLLTIPNWLKYDNINIKAQLLFNSCFLHPTVFIRKSILDTYQISYDSSYKQSQDYRMWEILSNCGEFANLRQKLLKYRLSDVQITTISSKQQAKYRDNISLRLKNEWLKNIGIEFSYSDFILCNDFLHIRNCLYNKICTYEDIIRFNVFMKSVYFNPSNKKYNLFIYSFVTGDFFRFSMIDKLKYIYANLFSI